MDAGAPFCDRFALERSLVLLVSGYNAGYVGAGVLAMET
jgi:hypothetical protein